MFAYTFPGEGAHLLTVWNKLDPATATAHPLMGLFAKPFGLANTSSVLFLVLATLLVGLLAARVVRRFTTGEDTAADARKGFLVAGVATAFAFLFSSAALATAIRIEPALFSLVAFLVAAHVLFAALVSDGWKVYFLLPLAGFCAGLFAAECPLVVACGPLVFAMTVWSVTRTRGIGRSVAAFALLGTGFVIGFVAYLGLFNSDFSSVLIDVKRGILVQFFVADDAGRARAVFGVLPLLATMLLTVHGFNERARLVRPALGFLAVLALAFFGLFGDFGAASVASAAFAALSAGTAFAFFFVAARACWRRRQPAGTRFRNFAFAFRGTVAGAIAVCLLLVAIRTVGRFDADEGSFADKLAERILDAVGTRTWLVTDGRLDDHLRIAAAKRGRDIALVNVSRDLDPAAKAALSDIVTARLGAAAPELLRSLDLGILTFLEDWIQSDTNAVSSLAVMTAPDVLFACGVPPVPEVLFFGTDPKAASDWSAWPELAALLPAPKGWGSDRLFERKDPVERLRLDLRRYLGLVANNRGVWLQDHGDRDGAFKMYTLVLDEIDADNVSTLFNLLQLVDDGYKPAVERASALRRQVKEIVADESRRYRLWALANYYGTIRNVPALMSLGFAWARSGRPGEALAQIRRAADLVPAERRSSLMGMIASLLADADQRRESRKMYEKRLAEKADDHDALIGLVRLELLDGDEAKARAYLERAVAVGGDDPRVRIELALLAMMKGDPAHARDLLRAVTASDAGNVKAWSLLAAVTMQLSDATKDPAARTALDRELEEKILPTMQSRARGAEDYYVQNARVFLALRKGAAGRKAARDALLAAVQARPDVPYSREMLIGLDIALNDPVAAESHARRTLRQDRNSPMANYVMGSLALGKGDLVRAESYLRKAVAAKKPSAFALNDYAETLRLAGRPEKAEPYARRVTKDFPKLYAGWDTLAATILDRKGNTAEALACATKAVELVTVNGRVQDPGILLTLARAQALAGDRKILNMTLRKLESRVDELNDRQKEAYEKLLKQ